MRRFLLLSLSFRFNTALLPPPLCIRSGFRFYRRPDCPTDFLFPAAQGPGLHHLIRNLYQVLKEFRKGEVQVLISTGAMTRGMDVEGIHNVINYDAPKYIKTYIHRAGRTARAGEFGRCFTLLLEEEVEQFKEMLQKAENHSRATYSLSSESIESLHPVYVSALEKLKELETSKNKRKR